VNINAVNSIFIYTSIHLLYHLFIDIEHTSFLSWNKSTLGDWLPTRRYHYHALGKLFLFPKVERNWGQNWIGEQRVKKIQKGILIHAGEYVYRLAGVRETSQK